jgi:hypothetical protein
MFIHIFRTDEETIKRFGFYRFNEVPYRDDVTQWSLPGEKGIGFICFFFGISVGSEYGGEQDG